MPKSFYAVLLALLLSSAASADSQKGTVVGTLTLDEKPIKLSHIYAQRREALPADSERFGLKDGEKLTAGVIDLIAANQPITQEMIDAIPQNKYQGSDLRGIWLLMDPSGKSSSVDYFLVTTGVLPARNGTVMISSQGSAKVERGMLTGKLESRIQEVSTVKAYSVLFDTPLVPGTYKTETVAASEEALQDFQNILPGNWVIERWWGDNGGTSSGTLTINQKSEENVLKGVFRFALASGGEVEESVIITRQGSMLHFEGSVAPDIKWNPDTLDFQLHGDLLIGNGKDTAGMTESVVLRKIREQVESDVK